MSVEIRQARPDDAAAIAELLAELGYPADAGSVRDRLGRLATEPGVTVVVAAVDGDLAGLAGLRVENLIEHEEPAGRLIALVVSERHRRRGIGAALVRHIESEARARGCCRLVLTSADARAEAHAFYRRVGFDQTGRRFAMELEEPRAPTLREPWPGLRRRLEGRLVVLDPLGREHADDLYEASRDPLIWRWLPYDGGRSRETFEAWLGHALGESLAGAEVAFATVDALTGHAIGSTRFMTLQPEHRSLEIGSTWITPSHWSTGANVEAKLLMLEHAFERLGCLRVEFKTDARNERSRGALEALPARFEGIFRKHRVLPGGGLRDSAYYSIVDDEWPEVRRNLQRRLGRL